MALASQRGFLDWRLTRLGKELFVCTMIRVGLGSQSAPSHEMTTNLICNNFEEDELSFVAIYPAYTLILRPLSFSSPESTNDFMHLHVDGPVWINL